MNRLTSYVDSSQGMRGGAFAGVSPLTSPAVTAANDEHGDPKIGWVLILLLVTMVILTVGYTAIYAGVQYGSPSWGAHAYPPPLVR